MGNKLVTRSEKPVYQVKREYSEPKKVLGPDG